jgi:8-oxo-dGTP diphosphatase
MNFKRDHLRAAVYVILRRGDEILMSQRFNTGYEDGKYSFVAGHVELDENPVAAMQREAFEEAGITIRKEDLRFVHVLHRNCVDGRVYVDYFFEARSWGGEPKIMEPNKCSAFTWFPLNNLPTTTIPYIREVLERTYKSQEIFSETGYTA